MNRAQCMNRGPAIPFQGRSWADLARRWAAVPFTLLETVFVWHERAKQREHLRSLDNRLLSDIGISRADAEREAAIPFWRAS